jgi:hypothetical protein
MLRVKPVTIGGINVRDSKWILRRARVNQKERSQPSRKKDT